MKRLIGPAFILLLVIIELILAFHGPMALVKKPSILVATPFTYSMDDEEVQAAFSHLQRAAARTRLFRVIPHTFIEHYYLEQKDQPDIELGSNTGYTEYRNIAREMNISRLLVCTMLPSEDHLDISLVLRGVEDGQVIHSLSYRTQDLAAFMDGEGMDGESFNITADLRLKTKGLTLFDNLFFLLLSGQVILALALYFRREPDLLNQILIVGGLLVFLFAFIYAKNASMDYVQRFIANKGQISLAENTATEQLYTFLRFGPLLLFNIAYYLFLRLGPGGKKSDTLLLPDRMSGIGRLTETWALPLSLLSALLYALAFPSFLSINGIPILAWFCLVPLFLAFLYSDFIRAVLYGIAFGALSTLIMNYWHGTYSYISLAFSVLLSSIVYILWMLPLVLLVKGSKKWGFLMLSLFWTAFDYLRSLGYIGYPWGFLGVSAYSSIPLIQIADLTGIWGITFMLVFWNAALTWTIAGPDFGWTWFSRRWIPVGAAATLLLLTLGYGAPHLLKGTPEDAGNMRVALIQQNRDPRKHDFWDSYRAVVRLSNDALRESGAKKPDLIVWPEGGFMKDIRYWLDRSSSSLTSVNRVQRFLEYQKRLGTWLLTGTQDHVYEENSEGDRIKRNFNSSVLLDDKGEIAGFYHKIHLVPFTEHFPYKEEFPWLAALLNKFGTSNWKQGDKRVIYEHPEARFFTPICFEDIFPDDIRRFVLEGADLIVNISNDFWSLTPVEGKQHGIHSLFRAVENRRPMVRATGSGLTTYIDINGRLSAEFPPYYTRGYLIVDIPIVERSTTFYTRHGDWFPLLCLWLTAAGALFIFVRFGTLLLKHRRRTT